MPFACTLSIASRPLTSGLPTYTCLSKRPGLNIAGSSISALFVAATTITPSLIPKPSISTRSWFNVCSLSSCPPPRPAPLRLPTASISSINTIQGAFFFAWSNKSLTREAPTPTNISTKSEPEIEKNGTFASPATAFARSVLPVPGGPTRSTPLGILAPKSRNFLESLRNSTISLSSAFSSSRPATLSNVTLFLSSIVTLALLLPKDIIFPPPPCIFWNINEKITTASIIIISDGSIEPSILVFGISSTVTSRLSSTIFWSIYSEKPLKEGTLLCITVPSLSSAFTVP